MASLSSWRGMAMAGRRARGCSLRKGRKQCNPQDWQWDGGAEPVPSQMRTLISNATLIICIQHHRTHRLLLRAGQGLLAGRRTPTKYPAYGQMIGISYDSTVPHPAPETEDEERPLYIWLDAFPHS